MRLKIILIIPLLLMGHFLFSQKGEKDSSINNTGYLLLDGIVTTFEKYQKNGSQDTDKKINESIDYFLTKAKQAKEFGEIDVEFFSRYQRILLVIKLSIMLQKEKGDQNEERVLNSLIFEEIKKFDSYNKKAEQTDDKKVETIAKALATEFLSLRYYLDQKIKDPLKEETDLKISEKFLLLSLEESSGRFHSKSVYIDHGLVGAILFELTQNEIIELKGNKVILKNNSYTGDFIMDSFIESIKRSKKIRSIRYWIKKLGKRAKTFKRFILFRFVENKILTIENEKILWFINKTRYPTLNEEPELKIKEHLYSIVLNKGKPQDEQAMLLSLINVCHLISSVFPQDQNYPTSKKRIKEISKGNIIGKAVRKTIKAKLDEDTIIFLNSIAVQ
jgi:hypothetical protein